MHLYLRIAILVGCFFSVFTLCSAESVEMQHVSTKDWKAELADIDAELQRMEEEQIRLKLSSTRWSDAGSRWQFQQVMTQEAKRAFEKADLDNAQIEKNQKYIDALQKRRAEILKEHPEANDIQGSP